MKSIKIKISIITVVFNGKYELEKTINSILSQTYQPIEYLIVDGGSNDGTIGIIQKYSDQIDYWISEKDNGIYWAMNKGINRATGEYLLFINCGDYLADDYVISDVVKIIEKNKKVDWFHGKIKLLEEDGTPSVANNKEIIISKKLNKFFDVLHPAVVYKKELHRVYGLYDTRFRISADKHFFMKVLNGNNQPLLLDRVVSCFKMGGVSSSFQSSFEELMINKEMGRTGFHPYVLFIIKTVPIVLKNNKFTRIIYNLLRKFIYKNT